MDNTDPYKTKFKEERLYMSTNQNLMQHMHYQCWLTSWYQQNANQPVQKQGQYSESHKEPDNSPVQMF